MTDLFITKPEGVKELKKAVEAWMATNPEKWDALPTRKLMEASGWTESRTWQVARRWVLEAKQPQLIVNLSEVTKDLEADKVDPTIAKIVVALRNQGCSWGEINVRLGITEGRVRSLFAKYSGLKDRGLRVGKGGRFVTDNPQLYLDNMKSEGAVIDGEFKGIPQKPEQCKNFKKAPKVRAPRKPRAAKVVAAA